MNLVIDIGNTRAKVGVFRNGALQHREILENWKIDDFIALATNHTVQNVILSTVAAAVADSLREVLASRFFFMELNAATPLPIENHYRTPDTLGKDRLAAVVGAYALFPGQSCLVVDAGTCITYDLLSSEGAYLGGNIAPGMAMRLKAMHTFTARLPLVEQGPLENWVGDSTESALRNGGQLGALLEAEGYLAYCRSRFGPLQAIFTGGDADFFVKNLKSEIFVNHNLVLIGLDQILNYNVKRLE
ncbi:MAG: type III pantothenate kinase [Lewinellaceae bacterium]|nr:type III pantothenate kinase [Phaeodactylibacter sp.]MCB0613744.1 type III pantothenate kinase [Phaeodactylibacter sp.]MCB9346609.1 type III pantothenate kinase [Lewinellaceae bacterium]